MSSIACAVLCVLAKQITYDWDILSFPALSVAPMDYESSIRILEFSAAGVQLVPVSILDDLILENTEYFSAHITTTDPFVVTTVEDHIIFITDNGEM